MVSLNVQRHIISLACVKIGVHSHKLCHCVVKIEDTREECYQKLINRLDTKINLKFQLIPCSNTNKHNLSLSLSVGYNPSQLMLCREIIHHFFMS